MAQEPSPADAVPSPASVSSHALYGPGGGPGPSARVRLDWNGRPIEIETQWVGAPTSPHPVVVFLHEGLGSVSAWRDFPSAFCHAHGLRGLLYSRYGYGRSTPKPATEKWPVDFMHAQALDMLPALLAALDISCPWLFGHSDGASIALLHASRRPTAGLVVIAPHLFVEDISVSSIEQARARYAAGELRAGLARHHDDPDSAFMGWNDAWLSPAFRSWNIEAELSTITCPVLAVQGEDDAYGTLEQVRGIVRRLPKTRLLVIPKCGHSPHRDATALLVREAGRFILEHDHSQQLS